MSSGLTITNIVIGAQGVAALFEEKGSLVRKRVREALRDLGAEAASRARALAPRGKTGHLQDSIRARVSAFRKEVKTLTVVVKPFRDKMHDAYYAPFIEFGVVRHTGAMGADGVLNISRRNKAIGGKKTKARNVRELRSAGTYRVKPHPFMGPAWESIRGKVQGSLERAVADATGGS